MASASWVVVKIVGEEEGWMTCSLEVGNLSFVVVVKGNTFEVVFLPR